MKNLKLLGLCFCFSFIIILGNSCQKDKCTPMGNCDGDIGVFVKMGGCGVTLELQDGRKLEDISLRLWAVDVNACTPYCVKFIEQADSLSTCSGAPAIELLEVIEL